MPSVITLAPIAMQLARIPLDELLPRAGVADAVRSHRESAPPLEAELPDDIAAFFGHYMVIVRAAVQLLQAPPFDRLARFQAEIEEEYMPGGPNSPVYDSFAMQFVLGAVPQGIGGETPYSVLARLLLRDPSRARLQLLAQSLAGARFEPYRVTVASGYAAELEPVRGGGALSVKLTGPFLRTGDLGLMRVLRFDDQHFIAESPYLLQATADDWREHLARIVAQEQGGAAAPVPAPAPPKASKLSSKQQARRRKKEKAKASRDKPEELLKRYLQFGLHERYWFDYVMDAYAGERHGIVLLAGVPDRPELLPHADEYEGGAAESSVPPMTAMYDQLLRNAKKEGLFDHALKQLRDLDADVEALVPNEQSLLVAYATLGLRANDGTTALARLERSRDAESLHPDARAWIESIHSGWFTVLRVNRIYLDEGLDAFDLLREQKVRISERAGTRQLAVGDLILGWVCRDSAGTLTLEGGLTLVPALAGECLLPLIEHLRRAMPAIKNEKAWKESAAELPIPLIAAILELRKSPTLPHLVNTSGEPIELITGHYRVREHARVVEALSHELQQNADGSYSWIDAADRVLARVELSSSVLRVQVNSRQRLKAAQERLEALLGNAVERSLEAHEDVGQAIRAHRAPSGKPGAKPQPLELPREVAEQLHEVVLSKIRSTLDDRIPQFQGKTLRQLAQSEKTRPDAVNWLREQERLLKTNAQLADLDMRPLWQELALPYQGLETDPP
jgi:hypothetical protein